MAQKRIWTDKKIIDMLLGSKEERDCVLKDYFRNRMRYFYRPLYEKEHLTTVKRIQELANTIAHHPRAFGIQNQLPPKVFEFIQTCVTEYTENLKEYWDEPLETAF